MDKASFRITVAAIVLLSLVLIQPLTLGAQCMVASTMISNPGPPTTIVYKILSAPYLCSTTMMNAVFCSPTAAMTTSFLLASAMSATINPSCAWTCACGPVTIDGSDGLPVELMGFEIEGEPAAAGDS